MSLRRGIGVAFISGGITLTVSNVAIAAIVWPHAWAQLAGISLGLMGFVTGLTMWAKEG